MFFVFIDFCVFGGEQSSCERLENQTPEKWPLQTKWKNQGVFDVFLVTEAFLYALREHLARPGSVLVSDRGLFASEAMLLLTRGGRK